MSQNPFDKLTSIEESVPLPPGLEARLGRRARTLRRRRAALASFLAAGLLGLSGLAVANVSFDSGSSPDQPVAGQNAPQTATSEQSAVAALRVLGDAGYLAAGGQMVDFTEINQVGEGSWSITVTLADCSGFETGRGCSLGDQAVLDVAQDGNDVVVTRASGFGPNGRSIEGHREPIRPVEAGFEFGKPAFSPSESDTNLLSIPAFWTGHITAEAWEGTCELSVGSWGHRFKVSVPTIEATRDMVLSISVPAGERGAAVDLQCSDYAAVPPPPGG